eukprot:9187207-Pyramimonas_sp.AAC.1
MGKHLNNSTRSAAWAGATARTSDTLGSGPLKSSPASELMGWSGPPKSSPSEMMGASGLPKSSSSSERWAPAAAAMTSMAILKRIISYEGFALLCETYGR